MADRKKHHPTSDANNPGGAKDKQAAREAPPTLGGHAGDRLRQFQLERGLPTEHPPKPEPTDAHGPGDRKQD